MSTHTLSAAPGTDIWRKPPHTDVYNAPYTPLSSGPLPNFLSATASFSFSPTVQYDQAGLLLTFQPLSTSSSSNPISPPPKWIKTGIEFYNAKPMLSTVATERWADWSVTPLTTTTDEWTTITIDKGKDEHGTSLWVYQILADGTRVPLREICWVYGDRPEEWSVEVSVMAARPGKEEGNGELVVKVKGAEVKWTE